MVETLKAARALQNELGSDYKVVVAMRYGEPSLYQAFDELKNCEKVIFFPQYPQYAESTFRTSIELFNEIFKNQKTTTIPPYFDHPEFILAYQNFLNDHLKDLDIDHILMSFHGLPETHILKTDPTKNHCLKQNHCCDHPSPQILKTCYRAQCYQSARKIAEKLKTPFTVSFQSRLGRQKWIEPYTESIFEDLIQKGYKKIAVICPGFPVDGLETLEEISMAGRKQFLQLGGESFHYIPCLNDDPWWIGACAHMIKDQAFNTSSEALL